MDDDWIPLGATDLGMSHSVDYDPQTGTLTTEIRTVTEDGVEILRIETPGAYPPGTPAEEVLLFDPC